MEKRRRGFLGWEKKRNKELAQTKGEH